MSEATKEWVSRREAARLLSCPVNTVQALADDGQIDVLAVPGTWLKFNRESVLAMLEKSVRRADSPKS